MSQNRPSSDKREKEKTKPSHGYCLLAWDCNGITTVQWCRAVFAVLKIPIQVVEAKMVAMIKHGVVCLLHAPQEKAEAYAAALNARRVLSTVEQDL